MVGQTELVPYGLTTSSTERTNIKFPSLIEEADCAPGVAPTLELFACAPAGQG